MPQLHLYVPDEIAQRIRAKASAEHVSVSRFLSELVRRGVDDAWPPGFWDEVVGGWAGEPAARSPQGTLEQRDPL